jgi:hypothetical protein
MTPTTNHDTNDDNNTLTRFRVFLLLVVVQIFSMLVVFVMIFVSSGITAVCFLFCFAGDVT